MTKSAILLACLLPLAGCGVMGTRPAGAGSQQFDPGDTGGNGEAPPEVVVIPAADALPVDGFEMSGRQGVDRFTDSTSTDSVDYLLDPNLIAFFLDNLVLELLDTGGPRLLDSLSFLERQCREEGIPDFICQQRYRR